MKVLVVCRQKQGKISPFIEEQVNSLINEGIDISFFYIKRGGFSGYLYHYKPFLKYVLKVKPDIIHAHNGLCGLFSSLQNFCPTVVTFHGSDINLYKSKLFSFFAYVISSKSIFVSEKLSKKFFIKNATIIPCGVDVSIFKIMDHSKCKKKYNLNHKINVLFASTFDNKIKNFNLAKKSLELLKNYDIEIVELKGFSREDVAQLLNAVDLLLLTSNSEGSPQIIKEAMACGCPIVSTDVGDVKWIVEGTDGCYVCKHDPYDISQKIVMALKFKEIRTNGPKRIFLLGLNNECIAKRIIEVYKNVLSL